MTKWVRVTKTEYVEFARANNLVWVEGELPEGVIYRTWWICSCGEPFYVSQSQIKQNARQGKKSCPWCNNSVPKQKRENPVNRQAKVWKRNTQRRRDRSERFVLEVMSHTPYECTNFDSWDGNKYFEFSWKCSKGHEFSANVGYVTCRKCSGSAPEQLISKLLDDRGINYTREQRFDTCKRKSALPFDFYLPDYNLLIEYQGGAHHGKGIRFDFDMQYRQENDQIKRDWAKANNIKLLEISATGITAITRIIETLVETQICHV